MIRLGRGHGGGERAGGGMKVRMRHEKSRSVEEEVGRGGRREALIIKGPITDRRIVH